MFQLQKRLRKKVCAWQGGLLTQTEKTSAHFFYYFIKPVAKFKSIFSGDDPFWGWLLL